MRRSTARRCLAASLPIVLGACAARTGPRPTPAEPRGRVSAGSFADAARPAAPSIDTRAHTDLDVFVASIIAAARARDLEALDQAMDPDFRADAFEEPTRAQILAMWRAEPALHLDDLAFRLAGPCAFLDGGATWICPRSVTELEEYGDSERVHFERRDDGWHWTVFISDDTSEAVFGRSIPVQAPSSAPLVGGDDSPLYADAPREPIGGALDREAVQAVVRAHLQEVRTCYERGLLRDARLEGRIEIVFTIGADGRVVESTPRASTLADPDVVACVSAAVRTWTFDKPRGGARVVVTYPFVLKPG